MSSLLNGTISVIPGNQPPRGKPLWDFSANEVERWIRSLAPGVANTGGVLFPAKPTAVATGSGAQEDTNLMQEYQKNLLIGNTLLQNLIHSISIASLNDRVSNGCIQSVDPTTKGDINGILDPSFSKSNVDGSATEKASELLPGGILSRLTLGGLVNALAAVPGGAVDTITCIPLADLHENDPVATTKSHACGYETSIESAGNLTLKNIIKVGKGLHQTIAARTEIDVMATTPRRIADLLCPEITDADLRAIRRRVYETVILGQGTHSSAQASLMEEETKEIPVAARTAKHEIEQWQRCNTCGNNHQALFILDRKNGDLICTNCGTVVSESIMHEGSMYRKFEGEEDRNHHGDAPNPLFSNSHNMSTTLGGVSFQPGAGMGGYGSGSKRNIENVLRNAHAYTEMNISQFGKDEKKTRIGYKDRQKKDAFYQMVHAGDALGLHEAVVQRAKELFAGFRDDRELVQQFKGVLAACLCESFDQLSRDGRQILKRRAGEVDDNNTSNSTNKDMVTTVHARASRRNDLHSASLAGKGGLLLDTTVVSHSTSSKNSSLVTLPFESKPAATWNLDDCRSWMMEASKSIAKFWSESQQTSQQKFTAEFNSSSIDSGLESIPRGTRDELEGKLIESTLKLCEFLESELNNSFINGKSKLVTSSHQRVKTPRVADMQNLGIKWQHSYERGSGGKGGVGNSGRGINGIRPTEAPKCSGRMAGQILLLLTAKKFGVVVGDMVAGHAFHKELKALIGKEDAKKQQERRDEASRARLKQMNRKPWLQKRVQL